MDEQFIRDRITALRQQKGISERKMSLDMGHSSSYIRSIATGRSLPAMAEFLYICDYLEVTPSEFFNVGQELDPLRQEGVDRMKGMSAKEVEFLLGVIQLMQKG